MMNFLFKKDLWFLDLIASLSFSLFFGYSILVDSVSRERKWKDILIGTAAYGVTFIFAVLSQKKFTNVRSWMWMGIAGALARITFLEIIYFSRLWNYNLQFSPNFFEAATKTLLELFQIILFNWVFWAIGGLIFVFVIRFAFFVILKVFSLRNLQTSDFQRGSK